MQIDNRNIFLNSKIQNIQALNNTKSNNSIVPSAVNQNIQDEYINSNEKQITSSKYQNLINETKEKQGFIGKLWDGFKNLTKIGASSDKASIAIEKYQNGEMSKEEMDKAVNGYVEGQKVCLDVVADMVSGIAAVGAIALAPVSGGTSLLLAAGVGAGLKVSIKGGDALLNKREYNIKDVIYDTVTGSINGFMAPVSNGLGGSVGTGVAKIFGLEAVESTAKAAMGQAAKAVGKEAVESVIETGAKQAGKGIINRILAKQGTEYIVKEGAKAGLKTTIGKVAAYGADMMVDGAISGATDGFARALGTGNIDEIPEQMKQGFIGGAIASPLIGGGFRIVGKAGSTALNKVNNKLTISKVLPDGVNTKFSQGEVGDCALLSVFDGLLDNSKMSKKIQKSIMTTSDGGYQVKIGNKIVKVSKDAITDEMLSDVSGIRIFEQAYKQVVGDIDGGFADEVASKFGLHPIHLTSDAITDEVLEKISQNSDNCILSLGARVNADGVVSSTGNFQHYFSIKNVDTNSRLVQLVDTYDTSKTFTMTFDDIKTNGISIDGGSIKKTSLPTSIRDVNDVKFNGVNQTSVVQSEATDDIKTQKIQDLNNVLHSIMRQKSDDIVVDSQLSDSVIKQATDLLTPPNTKEHDILSRLVKECFVNIKDKEDIQKLLLKQYLTLDNPGEVLILNPSVPEKLAQGIGTSNSYMCDWCSEAINLPKKSIFDASKVAELQALLNSANSKKYTIMVPDDFAGSGRSLSINTIKLLNGIELPKDVQLDVVLAPATATTYAKKIFKYLTKGDVKRLDASGALSSGGKSAPDIEIIKDFLANKPEGVKFRYSSEIKTVPTIYETSVYKSLTDTEKQVIETILTSDTNIGPGIGKTGLTGYGRDNLGLNCTMSAFPSNKISPETGLVIQKSPNNNLFGSMVYAIANGVNIDRIKPPGSTSKIKLERWTRDKQIVYNRLKGIKP